METTLQELRNDTKLTQEQVAEKMDVSVNTIQNWEHGRAAISKKNLHKLLDLYKVDLETQKYVMEKLVGSDHSTILPKTFFDLELELNVEEMEILVYCYCNGRKFFNKELELRDRVCNFEYTFYQAHGGMAVTVSKIQKIDQKLLAISKNAEDIYKFLYNWGLDNPNRGFALFAQSKSFIKDFFRKFKGIDFLELLYLCLQLSQPKLVEMPYKLVTCGKQVNKVLAIRSYIPISDDPYDPYGTNRRCPDFMEDTKAFSRYYIYDPLLPSLYRKCFNIEPKESINEDYLQRKSVYLLYQKERNAYLADPQTYIKKHIDEYMDIHIGKYPRFGIDNPPKFEYLYDAELKLTEYGQQYLKWALSDSFICSDEIKKIRSSLHTEKT